MNANSDPKALGLFSAYSPEVHTASVLECTQWGENLYSLKLNPVSALLSVLPGQYLKIWLPSGRAVPYSIAGFDANSGTIELLIEFNLNSESYRYLFECMGKCEPIKISLPHGSAFLRDDEGLKVICAQGTGYAYARRLLLSLSKRSESAVFIQCAGRYIDGLYDFIGRDKETNALNNVEIYILESDDVIASVNSALSTSELVTESQSMSVYAAGSQLFVDHLHASCQEIPTFKNFYSDLKKI